MGNITYVDEWKNLIEPDDFVAILPKGLDTKDKLLNALAETLQFPDYFGFNWDALNDCLKDLHWLGQRRILLIHEDPTLLTREDLAVYLDILEDTAKLWEGFGEHKLVAIFTKSAQNYLSSILRNRQSGSS